MCACFSDETWFRILLPNSSSIQTPNNPMSSGGMIPASSAWRRAYRSAVTHWQGELARVCKQCCDDMRHNWDMLCTWLCLQTVLWHCYMTYQDSAPAPLHLMEALTTSGPVRVRWKRVQGVQGSSRFSRTYFLVGRGKPTAILSHRFHYLSVQRIEQIDHTSHNSRHKRNTSSIET